MIPDPMQTTGVQRGLQIALFIGLIVSVQWMEAVPVVPLDLASIVAASDEIVVCQVTDVRELGMSKTTINGETVLVKEMDAHVAVERVIKGTSVTELDVNFLSPQKPIGYHTIPAHSHRVLLLKRSGRVLEPASPYYPSLPAGSAQLQPTQQWTAVDEVIAQMAASLLPPYGDLASREEVLWLLRFVHSPISAEALRVAATRDPDPNVKLNAVATLLADGDLSFLPIAEGVLLNPASANIPSAWRLNEIEQNLSSAIALVKDERAIPTLERILRSPEVQARRGAASALRKMASTNALSGLFEALTDSDFEVRYWGAVGLAEITGQTEWRPLRDDFKSNEAKYIEHWALWRAERHTR
jgi:hypothetical protein